jgi:hypothetical protein
VETEANKAWVRARLCKLQNGCSPHASDKAGQLLAYGRLLIPGSPTSSTTKTGRHDIAEILLQVELKHKIILIFEDNQQFRGKRCRNEQNKTN